MVDPRTGQIIAAAHDRRIRRPASAASNSSAASAANTSASASASPAFSLPAAPAHKYHSLAHAALVCIDAVAERDLRLYPEQLKHTTAGTRFTVAKQCSFVPFSESLFVFCCAVVETNKPYLCVGLDLYITREPCTFCAMALVHSRIGRVFYLSANPRSGALGSRYHLHADKRLNHSFGVWRLEAGAAPSSSAAASASAPSDVVVALHQQLDSLWTPATRAADARASAGWAVTSAQPSALSAASTSAPASQK
jgi:tRNA(Arg) A34 adenosine deaminase TadA